MISDKEFCEQMHILLHSVRLISGYKPTEMEKRISQAIIRKFPDCEECRTQGEKIKNAPPQKSFIGKLGGILTE
jgi:hypothetical protein